MQVRFQFLIIAAVAFLFCSCKKSNQQGRFIPSNAVVVLQINPKSLSSKLSWTEIKDNPLLKDLYEDTSLPSSIKKILEDPNNSGIDMKEDLLVFMVKDSIGSYVGFEGDINDHTAFQTFNAGVTENTPPIEKDGISYMSHSALCVGYNKEKFIYVFDAPQLHQMDQLSKRMQDDSIDVSNHHSRDIAATCKSLFMLTESSSLGKEEKFTRMLSEQGDMHVWLNSEQLNKYAGRETPLEMLNMEKLFKGNVTTTALNFDNGKINVNVRSYVSEELTALYKKYKGDNLNKEMLQRMPGQDMTGIIAFNFKPEGIKEFLKVMNLDGMVNLALPNLGFTLDDFIKANKGDVMIGVSDLKIITDSTKSIANDAEVYKMNPGSPTFNFIFSVSIADKPSFNKLMEAGKKATGAFTSDSSSPVTYNTNAAYFALGNSKENVDKYLAGSNKNFDFIDKITGQPFGAYVNLHSIIKTFESHTAKDSMETAIYEASINMWDNVWWKGGDFNNESITQSIEINLIDKNINSLKQLNKYSNTLSALYREKQKKQKEDMMAYEDALMPGNMKDSVVPVLPDLKEK
jgi:hypothetical protein